MEQLTNTVLTGIAATASSNEANEIPTMIWVAQPIRTSPRTGEAAAIDA